MAVRVDLAEGGRFIEILSEGHITRREAGWATERTCELLRTHDIAGILADSRGAERQVSPLLSGELIENFLFAVGRAVPTAYVLPESWSEEYTARVREQVTEWSQNARYFSSIETARDWLIASAGARA
jgi:hypothetical protein